MSERSVEEIIEIFDQHNIDLQDICKVIVHFYDFRVFDETIFGQLRDVAKQILNSSRSMKVLDDRGDDR